MKGTKIILLQDNSRDTRVERQNNTIASRKICKYIKFCNLQFLIENRILRLTCSNKNMPSTESVATSEGLRKQKILKNNCHLCPFSLRRRALYLNNIKISIFYRVKLLLLEGTIVISSGRDLVLFFSMH